MIRWCSKWGVDLEALAQCGVSKSDSNSHCVLADLQPSGSEGICRRAEPGSRGRRPRRAGGEVQSGVGIPFGSRAQFRV